MVNIKRAIFLIITVVSLLLTGCWDKVEINERAFVTAMGIDIISHEETNEEEKGEINIEGERYLVTYALPNVSAIGKDGQGVPEFVVSSIGMSPYETTRQLRTRLHQALFFSHMKILVIGEDVAKNSDMLKEMLDSVERNYEISRRINVLVAKGTAKEVLSVQSMFEADVGMYLSKNSEAAEGTARFNPITLGELLKHLHDDKNAIMPRVIPGEKDIKIAGSGVIKNYQLIGWLGEIENRSVMFLEDMIKSDVIIVATEKDKTLVPYLITHSKTKKTVEIEEGMIKATYMIEMEGDLNQFKMDSPEDVLDDKLLKDVETIIEKYIKSNILETVKKIQKEFKVDVIGVNDYLSKFKPDIWAEVKDDWENIFPDIDVEVKVDAKIRRIGVTK